MVLSKLSGIERATVKISELFQYNFTENFPEDPLKENRPREVKALYSFVPTSPVSKPRLLLWNKELSESLGFALSVEEIEQLFSGNIPLKKSYATNYGGHQFGHWAGQLGDGRAILLGERLDQTQKSWEIQLKGAGPTPYSRRGDGRAVLRSSIREFLCSEAMHFLGVPTSRALALIESGDQVWRDMFYDGHPKQEKGAIVTRVAPSFLRIGHIELLSARKDFTLLQQLLRYLMHKHSEPHFLTLSLEEALPLWLEDLSKKTGALFADWMLHGFVHGVLNTDNISLLGLTVDYGPFGFLDIYNPLFTPNTTDAEGKRYCYGRQAAIGSWNMERLCTALKPIFPDAPQALFRYENEFRENYTKGMARKLGLKTAPLSVLQKLDRALQAQECDYTLFFSALEEQASQNSFGSLDFLTKALYADLKEENIFLWKNFLSEWEQERKKDTAPFKNPRFILRNWLLQEAIEDAELGQYGKLEALYQRLKTPYTPHKEDHYFGQKMPVWARSKAGCSALSCSS